MSLQKTEDKLTREGLIARLYNAFCAGVSTKEQTLDLISEIAQAVDGKRPPAKKKTITRSPDAIKKRSAKVASSNE
ncbi:MAG: hypothetical protein ABF888_00040 [Acetobacter papayae]